MPTYCTRADLLLGNLTPPADAVLDKYVQDGADAIDVKLGFRYSTPIVVDTSIPGSDATTKLLKRLNVWLSSGLYIVASSTDAESIQLNAYGKMLLDQAETALNQIASGQQVLPGVAPNSGDPDSELYGPILNNLDPESQVEAFYTYVQNPYKSGYVPFGHKHLFPHGGG